MPNAARKLTTNPYDPSDARLRNIRPDAGNHIERQTLALELIAASLSRIADQQESTYGFMTYKEAAKVTTAGEDLLGKMVADGRLKQGRHYVRLGTRIGFVRNLAELILEDQLTLEETELEPGTQPSQDQERSTKDAERDTTIGRQTKVPSQKTKSAASKNRAGLDIDRARRAS